jgi:DNA-directed RNA polymerase subunit M/transcription elongation factor TFIIS
MSLVLEGALSLPLSFYVKPYNSIRRAKITLFSHIFSKYEDFVRLELDEKIDILKRLERACLNATVGKACDENIPPIWVNELFIEHYHSICAKVCANIDKEGSVKNPVLGNMILEGTIDVMSVPKMFSKDLFPGKYDSLIERLNKSKEVEQESRTTSMYTCGRCKTSKCKVANCYNRSLDEGISKRATCINCGFAWTMAG